MLKNYDVQVSPSLSLVFRERVAATLQGAGFMEVMRLAAPGTGVWEFKKENHIISLHIDAVEKGQERLAIACETLDLRPFIFSALEGMTREFLGSFLAPLGIRGEKNIEEAVKALFCDLGAGDEGNPG